MEQRTERDRESSDDESGQQDQSDNERTQGSDHIFLNIADHNDELFIGDEVFGVTPGQGG